MSGRETYLISGVCCSTEEAVLRRSLDRGLGKKRYHYNPTTCELHVPADVEHVRVLEQVRRAGFGARRSRDFAPEGTGWVRHRDAVVAGTAALLTAAGILLGHLGVPAEVLRALLLGAILLGGWKIAIKAFKALRSGTLDMNVLMSVAVLGALAIDRWAEGATVIVLFSVALMLETYSAARTRRAIRSMLQARPDQASVLTDEGEHPLPARQVVPGTRVRIRPGERIPVDGEVIEGVSSVDEAPITGESSPAEKSPGDQVFAGSINAWGSLEVRSTRAFEDTTLARIVHLIEAADRARAPVQQFVDRFARIYTPAVLALAAAVALLPPLVMGHPFGEWIYRGLVLLVIACPCALVISTPVSIVSALTNAARRGILIKGGVYLESLSRLRAVAFDKTGTLTEGRPRLTDIVVLDTMAEAELLRHVAALEEHSEHHLAGAVLREAALRNLQYGDLALESFEAMPGHGVRARINGAVFQVGSPRAFTGRPSLMSPEARAALRRLEEEGKSTLVVARQETVLGILAARDTVRERSRAVVEGLHRIGIVETVLLSGDRSASTARAAEETAVHSHRGELLPEEKVAEVEDLKRRHGVVAMVGDGVNDAPALAAASVGIAMGGSGTDTAMHTADVVLMGDAIERLPHLILVSRKAMAVIRQNIGLALGLKLLFLVLSLTGQATLWMAVLADDGAALAVILNGLRLLSFGGTGPRS
jgi:Cd2+/Zn2+-exporting ATPase